MALQTVLFYWVKVPALVVPTPGQQEVSALLVRPAFTLHLPYTLLLNDASSQLSGQDDVPSELMGYFACDSCCESYPHP